jgi:hypothetical protein
MTQFYVIYADVCCLNRPLDDLQQSRVKLEAEAMLSILLYAYSQHFGRVNSITSAPDSYTTSAGSFHLLRQVILV